MNAMELIERVRDHGKTVVYELYDAREHKKIGRMYKSYAKCIKASGFDLDEFYFREFYDGIDTEEFYDGALISHTEDFEWYIVVTVLQ